MHYVVDGYNLLFRQENVERLSLQQRRDQLIDELAAAAERRQMPITVVFDAAYVEGGGRSHVQQLQVIYSDQGQTADEAILEMLEHASGPQTVITADRPLAMQVRALGGQVLPIAEFRRLLKKTPKSVRRAKPSSQPRPERKSDTEHYLEVFESRHEAAVQSQRPTRSTTRNVSNPIAKFFAYYARMLTEGKVDELLELYALPCPFTSPNATTLYESANQLRRHLTTTLTDYHAQGLEKATAEVLWTTRLGRVSTTARVQWQLWTQKGKLGRPFDVIYHLKTEGKKVRIFAVVS